MRVIEVGTRQCERQEEDKIIDIFERTAIGNGNAS
jgi:hypothetical protein